MTKRIYTVLDCVALAAVAMIVWQAFATGGIALLLAGR